MNGRRLRVSLVIGVSLAIMLTVLWRHRRAAHVTEALHTLNSRLAMTGVIRGITRSQFEEATNDLVREHRAWSRFTGISGDIKMRLVTSNGKRYQLGGRVAIHRAALPLTRVAHAPAPYEMSLSDVLGNWSVRVGAGGVATIHCGEQHTLEAIRAIDPASVLQLLTLPGTLLRDLPSAVDPRFGCRLGEMGLQPWLTTTNWCGRPHRWPGTPPAQVAAGILTFCTVNGPSVSYVFRHQRLWEWRYFGMWSAGVRDFAACYFEKPAELGDMHYPTVFRVDPLPPRWPWPGGILTVTNLVQTSPPEGGGSLFVLLSHVSPSGGARLRPGSEHTLGGRAPGGRTVYGRDFVTDERR